MPHQLSDGRYLLRVRDQNLPFPADQIAVLKRAKADGQYKRQFVHEAHFEDLDEELLEQFAERLNADRSRPIEEILYHDYRRWHSSVSKANRCSYNSSTTLRSPRAQHARQLRRHRHPHAAQSNKSNLSP